MHNSFFSAPKSGFSQDECQRLLSILKDRFESDMSGHAGLEWTKVQVKLESNSGKLWFLIEIEKTGGQPGATGYDKAAGEFVFVDCSPETPKGRRNVCYDGEGTGETGKALGAPCRQRSGYGSRKGIELLDDE